MMPGPLLKFATGVAALQLAAGVSLRSNDGESARMIRQSTMNNPLKKLGGLALKNTQAGAGRRCSKSSTFWFSSSPTTTTTERRGHVKKVRGMVIKM